MRKPNYAHQKRQRDLEKQKKREEKRLNKASRKGTTETSPTETDAPPSGNASEPEGT